MPSLFVIRGNDQGSRYELEDPIVRMGRDKSCTLHLHDTEVSRQHAELRRTHRDYTVSDLDSSNGTYVNGNRIQQHVLVSGDHVQVGATLMLYTGPLDESSTGIDDSVKIIGLRVDGRRLADRPLDDAAGGQPDFQHPGGTAAEFLACPRGSNLQVMYRTALAVSHTLDIDQLLHRIMRVDLRVGRGRPRLHHALRRRLAAAGSPRCAATRNNDQRDDKITISKTILDYVIERNEGVLTSDARQDDRFSPAASIVRMGVREAICVPMQGRYDVVGVIYIDTSTSPQQVLQRGAAAQQFTEDHLKLMIAIAHQAALAVEDTRYYSAMVQAERLAAIGQTIATLSHHIKNILQGIRGGSYLIEMGLTEHDETIVGKGWNIVEKNQNKISALVMDMLTFSKEREPDLTTANVNTVVNDVVELMQVRAEEEQIELRMIAEADMPDMVFDPEGIHRAVLNVVTNAIDAVAETDPPRGVVVETRRLADQSAVEIEVRDTGPGIAADQLDTLFSPFISSKKSRGTGLGLPVSQKILSEHGGKITVENLPGHGACFTLEFPAVSPSAKPPAVGVPAQA